MRETPGGDTEVYGGNRMADLVLWGHVEVWPRELGKVGSRGM